MKKIIHSSNPIVQRALETAQAREARQKLHSSNPIVERALQRKFDDAVREAGDRVFEAICDRSNADKAKSARDAIEAARRLQNEIKQKGSAQ